MKVINCESIREDMLSEAKQQVHTIKAKYGEQPCLVVIQVGDNPASTTYVNNKIKTCEKVGIRSELFKLPESSSFTDIKKVIKSCNKSEKCHAILLQLPLPKHLKKHEQELIDMIYHKKDVDGLTTLNIGKLWSGQECIEPCTPKGVMRILESADVDLSGLNVCVIGRSNLFGKPMVALLNKANTTVTWCHSKSISVTSDILNSDIIITAIGMPKYWDGQLFDQAVVIDVGINRDENGKLCGDINWDNIPEYVDSIYTPVPKGVGIITTAQLMLNTIKCYNLQK